MVTALLQGHKQQCLSQMSQHRAQGRVQEGTGTDLPEASPLLPGMRKKSPQTRGRTCPRGGLDSSAPHSCHGGALRETQVLGGSVPPDCTIPHCQYRAQKASHHQEPTQRPSSGKPNSQRWKESDFPEALTP